jgi:ATP-dependent exoDNAse (exonuclease V) beta subunit
MIEKDLITEDEISRSAALALDSFIVEAPAGAGKTELLTQRFLKLLQTVEAPEEIIAITFTNKAASEMRTRIMDSLQMAASGITPEQAHKKITFDLGQKALTRSSELNWQLLATPSRLRIYTIDSLSGNLARQMPLLSRFGTQPAVRDDASSYYQEATTRALEYLDDAEYGNIVQSALRYFDNDTYKLTQLLAEMLAKRDQWLPYTQSANTALAAEDALAHMIMQEIQVTAKVLDHHLQTALMPIARYAASNVSSDSPISRLLDWDKPIPANPTALSMWQALADLLLTSSGNLRKRLDKNMGLPATDEAKPYKEALLETIETLSQISSAEPVIARLKQLPQPAQDENTWQIIATLSKLLNIAVGELWLVFQAHGEVDFVEISQRALLALEDTTGAPTDLALRLDYRIQHLLVDEFQDTSPTQIKLMQALTQGWQTGDGRTLFCVGDPMQSIYRFRKANVGLFLRVAEEGIGAIQLKPLKLWRNNRSSPAVVNWVNHAFAQVFPTCDSVTYGAIQYRPFVATKSAEDKAGITFHAMLDDQDSADIETEEDETLVINNIRQFEADRIIQIIQLTRSEKPEAKIAVLVRARSHLHALVTEIRRNHPGLNFQAVEIEELANRQIVQDLLSLTHALHQRAGRVHWLAVLRAPWCGLTLADMHALIGNDKYSTIMQLMTDEQRIKALSEDGQQRLLHVRKVMQEALSHRGRMTISRWIHGVWLMLGGAECLWDAGDVRDVQAFFERIQQLERNGQFSPDQLATEVQKLYAAPDAKADEKLQFMTIHKSKGLEFDTVILPSLDCKTGRSEQPLLLWEEVSREEAHDPSGVDLIVAPLVPKEAKNGQVTPYDYLKMLEKERAAYEDARVLYVAATRTERHLHLLAAAKVNKKGEIVPPKNTFLEMLWPIVQAEFHTEHVLKLSASTQTKSTSTIDHFIPKLVRVRTPQIPVVFIEQNSKNIPHQIENSNKEDDSDTFNADVGTLVHLYLDLISNSDLSLWHAARVDALTSAMQRWFKQKNYNVMQCKQGADIVIQLLKSALASEDGQWVLKSRPTADSELAIESVDSLSVTKKVIDRTFIEDGTRWVIDYKTTALASNTDAPTLRGVTEQYQEQLEGYAQLFANETLPIQKAILFVSLGKLCLL